MPEGQPPHVRGPRIRKHMEIFKANKLKARNGTFWLEGNFKQDLSYVL